MEYRRFLDSSEDVGVIGLGVEHLRESPSDVVCAVACAGFGRGVNYVDLVWSLPSIVMGVSAAIQTVSHRIYTAIHLGSGIRNAKYYRTRKPDECKKYFLEVLEKLPSNVIPIINIHYVNKLKDWRKYSRPGEVLDTAIELKEEGHGRYIAVSTHSVELLSELAEHPSVNSVMFQVNMANHTLAGRDEALKRCETHGKRVVAMKPYAGGRLLKTGMNTKVLGYMRAGKSIEFNVPGHLSSHKCLSYTLDQIGVCCAVSGASKVDEIEDSLDYFEASDTEYRRELDEILEQIK